MQLKTFMCAIGALCVTLVQPANAADDEMFDWSLMAKSVAAAAKAHPTLDEWKGATNSSYPASYDAALAQVTERCPTIIAALPEEARPGLNVNFDTFCECYDSELVDLSMSAMFESNRMGENGKSMEERRKAWENLFDIPHEERLGGCVVKTTQVK